MNIHRKTIMDRMIIMDSFIGKYKDSMSEEEFLKLKDSILFELNTIKSLMSNLELHYYNNK